MAGFFSAAAITAPNKVTADSLPLCGACGLLNHCQTPKIPVSGYGEKGILIVSEAPGELEDSQGRSLVGSSGRLLRYHLDQLGIDLDEDCWKTNAIICRPTHLSTGKGRKAADSEIEYCRPNLLKAIRDLSPHTIILLGGVATKSLLGHLDLDDAGMISKWAGWDIPCQDLNAWICPTWHPQYLIREENEVLDLWHLRHLDQAVRHDRRPWSKVPDYSNEVEVVYDPEVAAKIIRKIISLGGLTAFDYETNMLKPDGPKAQIVCASLSWKGKKTIAFPWHGEAIKAMREFLLSDLPKIGANIKFEERWSKALLGVTAKKWVWDTVQAAHILDNRPGITGVKFQAFVNLGLSPYNQLIEPYFESKDSRSENRIKEADFAELLRYCGVDSLVEYRLAEIQMKKMGMESWFM